MVGNDLNCYFFFCENEVFRVVLTFMSGFNDNEEEITALAK